MSRKSSFGYSSYGTHSYKSGSYRSKKNKDNKRKKVIAAVIITAVVILAAVAVLLIVFVFGGSGGSHQKNTADSSNSIKNSQVQKSSVQESSAVQSSADPNKKGYFDGSVFIYDKQGYELFYGKNDTAVQYAEAVSSIKKSLGKDINVYNMVVPTHSVFGMPSNYLQDSSNERENIKKIYSSYSEDVKAIDVYDTLDSHKSEYIYFRTDNKWTALGAYYGYEKYCESAGIQPIDINSLSTGTIENFGGTLLAATVSDEEPDGNEELAKNLDTVLYYNVKGDYDCRLLERGASEEKEATLIATFAEESNAYSAFIWGDNPYMKITSNRENKTGKKLCIIKDSYGCAFAPFTAANYDEIFIVDPQFYDGNVLDYIKENNYTDVLVINSIMNANTAMRTDWLYSILKS